MHPACEQDFLGISDGSLVKQPARHPSSPRTPLHTQLSLAGSAHPPVQASAGPHHYILLPTASRLSQPHAEQPGLRQHAPDIWAKDPCKGIALGMQERNCMRGSSAKLCQQDCGVPCYLQNIKFVSIPENKKTWTLTYRCWPLQSSGLLSPY